MPLANSLYARVKMGDGADMIPESMLHTTIDWIQWKTSSTLHSAFFKDFKEVTSMPVPSMTPAQFCKQTYTQETNWTDCLIVAATDVNI